MNFKYNILVIDDVEENTQGLVTLIKTNFTDIKVYGSSSAKEGLDVLYENEIDLILLDIQMPIMNGYEFAKVLAKNSATKDIPIVFVTAVFTDEEFVKMGFELGAIDYITKPIGTMYLINKIKLYMKMLEKQKKMEIALKSEREALNSNKSKSTFLANMSHEIRTPLNAILGFVDILKEQKQDVKSLEYLNIIDESGQGLLKIIEDILDFSKIESGKIDIDKIDFNTREELKIVSHLFQAKSSQENINLSVIFDENLPLAINTDPLRVKQVIANLISNAIKFTKSEKNIFVTFGFDDGSLKVSVKDEGKGIAKDKLSHIFDAFSQEDSSTTREFGGTGLGLSISSELVKLLGGELKVKSELGVGSEFYFCIPVKIAKDSILKKEDTKDISFNGKKILLVEDNKANQLFMKIILKKMGLEFDIANDGVEAVEIFKENKYDAILMDENMPNMSGAEATKNILKIEKENNLEHTLIVALTANALKGDRERFLEAGMDDYLTKPVDRTNLSKVLRKYFDD